MGKWIRKQYLALSGDHVNNTKQVIKTGVIKIPGDRYFPEGVTVTSDGTFFVGSLFEGCIMRSKAATSVMEPFIEPGINGLVSVLGLWADETRNLLWACSSDAGNGRLTGHAPVGVRAFDLQTGAAAGGYDFPGGGFANDLTIDANGNLYVTDSWTPRLLRLSDGGSVLEEWIQDPQLGVEQWSLNGIDYDRFNHVIYTVNQRAGLLFRIAIEPDGSAGLVTQIQTSQELRRPDGLKVIGHNTLATAEGGEGGMAILSVEGDKAWVRRVPAGLDGVSTFAYYQGSAWVVEGQSDHFWDPINAGPDADPPFRIVEVLIDLLAFDGL
jgi:sugar lactone lactonase YvrE